MTNQLLMIGTSELLLIAALVLLLFGGKKLPEMMKGLGQGVRSFKDGMREGAEEPTAPNQSAPEAPVSANGEAAAKSASSDVELKKPDAE